MEKSFDLRKAVEMAFKALLLRRNQITSPEEYGKMADEAAHALHVALINGLPEDAQRFKWLSDHAIATCSVSDPDGLVQVWCGTEGKLVYKGRTLREAVDAAMKAASLEAV